MNNTLVISDLDGTLLNQDAKLSRYAISALNAMIISGMNFTIATARTYETAGIILEDLRLRLPIILMNGVLIYDPVIQEYMQVHKLPDEAINAIIEAIKKHDADGLMYELKDGKLTTYYQGNIEQKPLNSFVEERRTRYNKVFEQTDDFSKIPSDDIIYFVFLDETDKLLDVYNAIKTIPELSAIMYKDNYSKDLWYLEVHSANASKKTALDQMREQYDYDTIIGFGDNRNDIPLFEACDIKIAVMNAVEELKEKADHICFENYADGVVRWLEKNLFTARIMMFPY